MNDASGLEHVQVQHIIFPVNILCQSRVVTMCFHSTWKYTFALHQAPNVCVLRLAIVS